MKKGLKVMIIFLILLMSITTAQATDSDFIMDGTYVQMGRYDGEPILWRCITTNDDDENGKLLLSDRILCYKKFDESHGDTSDYRYGNGYWPQSNIRAWLNSTAGAGNVSWLCDYPPISGSFPYSVEAGFISSDNFTKNELSAMKTVAQWLILTRYHEDEVTNGINNFFQTNLTPGGRSEAESFHYGSLSNLLHIEGGMCRCTDTMFLIDEVQAYKLWKKHDAFSEPTDLAREKFFSVEREEWKVNSYWLRTQWGMETVNHVSGSDKYNQFIANGALGVRPAFYLNDDNVHVLSGSGEWYDPYIIEGYSQENIEVFSQGKQLLFDRTPINENGRLLLPVRFVAESLGLDVTYNEQTREIKASDKERNVVLKIGSREMNVDDKVIQLDVEPKISNNRTMIPLRAISEAFDAEVSYIENLNRVVIDKPAAQDFGDGYGLETWQQSRAAKNGTFDPKYYEEVYGIKWQ